MANNEDFDPYRKWLGIPQKHQPPNHYRLLGIQIFEDDPDVIESAANARMAHLRTFQNSKRAELSQKLLNEISTAKICLLREEQREEYDRELKKELLKKKTKLGGKQPPAPLPANDAPVGEVVDDEPSISVPGAKAAVSRAARKRTKKSNTAPIAVSIGCVVGLVIVGIAIVAATSGNSGDKKSGESKTDKAKSPRKVVKQTDGKPIIPPKDPSPKNPLDKPPKDDDPSPQSPRRNVADATENSADLLAVIDAEQDAVSGEWVANATTSNLTAGGQAETAVLQLPCKLPPFYTLKASFERTSDEGSCSVGLVVGDRQVRAVIDGEHDDARHSGIEPANEEWGTGRDGQLLEVGSPREFEFVVLPDRIVMLSDDEVLVDWQGQFDDVSLPANVRAGDDDQLWLSVSGGEFTIAALKIEPIADPSAYKVPGDEPPPVVVKQEPVPHETVIFAAQAKLKAAYAEEVKKADLPSEKVALAKQMMADAAESDDIGQRYSLLLAAEALASGLGDADVATEAIGQRVKLFKELDVVQTRADMVLRCAAMAKISTTRRSVANVGLAVAELAVTEKRFDLALQLLKTAEAAATAARDPVLAKRIGERYAEVEALQES